MKKILTLLLSLAVFVPAFATVKLPALVGDNMVLQRNTTVRLWGEATAAKNITLSVSWDKKKYSATADNDGRWAFDVETPGAGGPYSVTISDGTPVTIENVMIGEVWICSGQSNMYMMLKGGVSQYIERSTETILRAGKYPGLRLFTVKREAAKIPSANGGGQWEVSSPATAAVFGAVAYFFGATLSDALDIPIGLINASWGGSIAAAWLPKEQADELAAIGYKPEVVDETPERHTPAMLYNGMIAPIRNYTARGFIWYQGESDRQFSKVYDQVMVTLAETWRREWNNPEMPFYMVELAPHKYDSDKGISRPLQVEAQHKAAKRLKKSGIAGTVDIGDRVCIHPPFKYEVGQRLALLALYNDYDMKAIEATGPEFRSAEFGKDGEVTVDFHTPAGFRYEENLTGFELAGEDRKFYPAKGSVVYQKNRVVLRSEHVPDPVAVRYGFRNWCRGNLFNVAGVPAYPFRTDDWEN